MYLITETKIFVDPHGEQDDGGTIKFISTEGDKYLEMNPDDDEELCGSEDGYNSTYTYYDVREITPEQAEEYKKIIEDYNKL